MKRGGDGGGDGDAGKAKRQQIIFAAHRMGVSAARRGRVVGLGISHGREALADAKLVDAFIDDVDNDDDDDDDDYDGNPLNRLIPGLDMPVADGGAADEVVAAYWRSVARAADTVATTDGGNGSSGSTEAVVLETAATVATDGGNVT